MKATLILALLAVTPVLMAAEPDPATAALSSTNAPAAQEDLAEQAALVQQIGAEAARGFDSEAHAHALRLQMEALVSTNTAKADKPAVPMEPPAVVASSSKTGVTALPTRLPAPVAPPLPHETAIREAIQKLRAVLGELEGELQRNRNSQSLAP